MELVTVYWLLTITGAGETVVHSACETRSVVDCNVNPVALVGQVKITLGPEEMIVSCGWIGWIGASIRSIVLNPAGLAVRSGGVFGGIRV